LKSILRRQEEAQDNVAFNPKCFVY